MKNKFKIGQTIITNKGVKGHVVMILNPMSDSRTYFCSMYPGAEADYQYVEVVDLVMGVFGENQIQTLQALNTYSEDELSLFNFEEDENI